MPMKQLYWQQSLTSAIPTRVTWVDHKVTTYKKGKITDFGINKISIKVITYKMYSIQSDTNENMNLKTGTISTTPIFQGIFSVRRGLSSFRQNFLAKF